MASSHYDKHYVTKVVIRRDLPKMRVDDIDWDRASDPTPDHGYNCFGFAVGVLKWWERPDIRHGVNLTPYCYWPNGLPKDISIGAFILAAESQGFVLCSEAEWEQSTAEKIVLYHKGNDFTHAARHTSGNRLMSKLGTLSDVEHERDAADCPGYGDGRKYMVKSGGAAVTAVVRAAAASH